MNGKELALTVGCAALVVAGGTYTALTMINPEPVLAENVGLVMLSNAMKKVDSAVAAVSPGDAVALLECDSRGNRTVTCRATGTEAHKATGPQIYRVSFAAESNPPAFELKGRRYDHNVYVTSFDGVAPVIPARDVNLFTSSFDGRITTLNAD